jgi:hypothetical protein
MIGFIGISLQLQPIITAHNQWLSKTRAIPYWTTSVFSSAVTNAKRRVPAHSLEASRVESESYVTTEVQSASLCCNKAPIWGLTTRFLLLSDNCGFVDVERSLWWEDGSGVYNCCWSSPVQSFSSPSPVGLETIFYCLRFKTSLFVASYDSQGYGGDIRPRLDARLIISIIFFKL